MTEPRWRRRLHSHELPWYPEAVATKAVPELAVDGDDPVIGRILGPTGAVIATVRPPTAPRLPFGFR